MNKVIKSVVGVIFSCKCPSNPFESKTRMVWCEAGQLFEHQPEKCCVLLLFFFVFVGEGGGGGVLQKLARGF